MTSADVLVLGAGVAGLAAARALADQGLRPLVLEARDRIGGRVWTDHEMVPGLPVELGAEFVHGEHVVTWRLIERWGLRTRRWAKADESRVRMCDGRLLTMAQARAGDAAFAVTRAWELPDVPPWPYEDLRHYLVRIGFTPQQLQYVRRSFANAVGEAMHLVSARAAYASLVGWADAGKEDYRIVEGYDGIPIGLAQGLNIRTGQRVVRVGWGRGAAVVETETGDTYSADAVVVTLPVGVLRTGRIRFEPGLPSAKLEALRGLHMGPVVKMVYVFDEPVTAPDVMAMYSAQRPPMWWSPSSGRDAAGQVWTAFVSGAMATDLLELGDEGALDEGLAAFGRELGGPLPVPSRRRLVAWPDDGDALGGYSVVLAGFDGAREALAAATPPLFWAGEATEPEARAATVHGAYLSGVRVAAEVTGRRRGAAERGPRTTARGPEDVRSYG